MIADRKKQSEAKRFSVVGSENEQAKERFAFFSGCVGTEGGAVQAGATATPQVALTAPPSVLIYAREGEGLGTDLRVFYLERRGTRFAW